MYATLQAMAASNPLVRDRDVNFLLYEVHDALRLCALPHFADHDRETFDLFLGSAARLSREQLFPSYREMDEVGSTMADGRVRVPPAMADLWRQLCDLGLVSASRPYEVEGGQLPSTIATVAYLYLMAGNAAAVGFALLTSGSAHLIEAFGDEALREAFMARMYSGEWTGTMALTEPAAGSALGDLTTRAEPVEGRDGVYRISGSKIFISGGDNDFCENVVHLTLARRVGDPAGTRGISLFVVPRMRPAGGDLSSDRLEFNDVHTSQLIHKIGWRGLPSLGLSYGEGGDCQGWLLGEPGKGLKYMFQMMNEARILVGANATATASAAYHESLAYARERTQGRRLDRRGDRPVPLIEHPDVRRMLLRQKAIVEGSMSLLVEAGVASDLAEHGESAEVREKARLILDILTPITKTFAAERGFEANNLALQIFGGYGYSSEHLPELWLREQRLNTIHEGTTGIQSLDLLGRKVVAGGGKALVVLAEALGRDIAAARSSGADEELAAVIEVELARAIEVTRALASRGASGDPIGMLGHSVDFLSLFANLLVGWQWLRSAAAAARGLRAKPSPEEVDFYAGKIAAARYWIRTELADNARLAALCLSAEDSYISVADASF